jgi:uncharacterized protein
LPEWPEVTDRVLVPVGPGRVAAADIYHPSADLEPAPTLVQFCPYRKDDYMAGTFAEAHERFLRAGFACVLADFPGSGSSPGPASRPFAPEEATDSAALVEWAAQQPWCSGDVGMWGVSYGAITALKAAALKPAGLKAIAPIHGTLDLYRDWVYPGGCRHAYPALHWGGVNMLGLQLLPPAVRDASGEWRRIWQEKIESVEPYMAEWYEHPERDDEYWQDRTMDPGAIEAPALFIGGWQDFYAQGMPRTFNEVNGPKQLVMGPWTHEDPNLSAFAPTDHLALLVDWFKRWLVPGDAERGSTDSETVRYWVQGAGAGWAAAERWPPPSGQESVLYLSGDGELTDGPAGAGKGGLEINCDPTIGVTSGLDDGLGSGVGRAGDQGPDERRSLTFTSSPLERDQVIAGSPTLRLALTHVDPDFHPGVVAKLSVLTAEGSSLISKGWCQARADGVVEIEMWDTAYRLTAGSRLRVSVAGADFPRVVGAIGARRPRIDLSAPDQNVLEYLNADPEAAKFPPLPAVPPASEDDVSWTTTTNHLTGEVDVRMTHTGEFPSTDGQGTVRTTQEWSAAARPDGLDGGVFRGKSRLLSRHAGHSDVRVVATSEAGVDHCVAHAAVWEGDVLLLDRTWTSGSPQG